MNVVGEQCVGESAARRRSAVDQLLLQIAQLLQFELLPVVVVLRRVQLGDEHSVSCARCARMLVDLEPAAHAASRRFRRRRRTGCGGRRDRRRRRGWADEVACKQSSHNFGQHTLERRRPLMDVDIILFLHARAGSAFLALTTAAPVYDDRRDTRRPHECVVIRVGVARECRRGRVDHCRLVAALDGGRVVLRLMSESRTTTAYRRVVQ